MQPLQQRLPNEVIAHIFREADDFLWVTCRQLSCELRAEVEFSTQTVHLKDTIIYWPVDGRIAHVPLPARLPFTRFSDDDVISCSKANIEERMHMDSPAVRVLMDVHDFQSLSTISPPTTEEVHESRQDWRLADNAHWAWTEHNVHDGYLASQPAAS